MSKDYRVAMKANGGKNLSKTKMRKFCQRPGRVDEHGQILYTTEQSHKDQCDINKIIPKYDRTGVLAHASKFEAHFGDFTGMEFKRMADQVVNAQAQFDNLPSDIRTRFKNDPAELLSFMENSNNRPEAIKLGLINQTWDEALDGLGEHVIRDENGQVQPAEPSKTSAAEPGQTKGQNNG